MNKNPSFLHVIFTLVTALIVSMVCVFAFSYFVLGVDLTSFKYKDSENIAGRIRLEELSDMLKDDEHVVLLDVRDEKDYAREHIKDSINIPYSELFMSESIEGVSKSSDIVIISLGNNLDELLSSYVSSLGYQNVYFLEHGLRHPEIGNLNIVESMISPEELGEMILMGSNVHIVDLRPKDKYEKGHIAGADSVPIESLEEMKSELTTEDMTVLYCDDELCPEAEEAYGLLIENEELNKESLKILYGGYKAWINKSYPIE